jgi:hypothetical protein
MPSAVKLTRRRVGGRCCGAENAFILLWEQDAAVLECKLHLMGMLKLKGAQIDATRGGSALKSLRRHYCVPGRQCQAKMFR